VLACSLLVLFVRGEPSTELEVLVLRYELWILRRRVKRPRFVLRDRLMRAGDDDEAWVY
jgi:hypothetical protein